MQKVFGINLGKNQVQLSCMEYDPKDFDRTDDQLRFRVTENKDFLADIYYVYNAFVNNFDIHIDNKLYKNSLRRNCLVNNIVWLYLTQLGDPLSCRKELERQKLIFLSQRISKTKEQNTKKKGIQKTSFTKQKTLLNGNTVSRKTNSKVANKSKIYSEKSLDLHSVTDVEEFNIFEGESVTSLPNKIFDFQIRLRSDYFEEKVANNQVDQVRFIGNEGFIAQAERKYLKGIDRANDILIWDDQEKANAFQIQRDKLVNIREVFRDFIEKIIEYIKQKHGLGKKHNPKIKYSSFFQYHRNAPSYKSRLCIKISNHSSLFLSSSL